MRYFSMFSGIGGFELGINNAYLVRHEEEQAKGTSDKHLSDTTSKNGSRGQQCSVCIGYSEIDKYAIATYEKNFGKETRNYGDATRINTAELPDFDLLVGGFPCQAFSVAGKRAGFEDTRGTLIFDVVRVLRDKRPRYFVLENVKGLLSHDSGKTFSHILEILTDAGYDISWSVHNSKNYGVPQNRERIYLIGSLRGERRPQVFPITTTDREAVISNTIRTGGKGSLSAKHAWDLVQINQPTYSNDRVYSDKGISPTLNTMQGGNRQPFIAPVLTPDRLEKRQNGRRFKENGEPSFTLNCQDRHGIYDGIKIRRLTPTECELLQGFPRNWTIGSDTQRYKQCGNAVTVNVVQSVIEQLMEDL